MPVSWQTIFLIIRYLCKHKAGIQELIGDISKIVCWRGGGQGCGRERASRAPVGVVHGGRAPGASGGPADSNITALGKGILNITVKLCDL